MGVEFKIGLLLKFIGVRTHLYLQLFQNKWVPTAIFNVYLLCFFNTYLKKKCFLNLFFKKNKIFVCFIIIFPQYGLF